jgi:hypothetical protein
MSRKVANRKKILSTSGDRQTHETKNQNLATKILSGWIERRFVACRKKGCKCSRGELHGPYFYHVTTDQTERTRRYIRRRDVPEVAQATQNHRELQAQLLAGRRQYKAILARARALFGEG